MATNWRYGSACLRAHNSQTKEILSRLNSYIDVVQHPASQGSILDGHKLALQLSLRRLGGKAAQKEAATAAAPDTSKAKGTKLVVRNVAFEATRKDVAALFAPFGQIKSCRLPKKFDGNHRCPLRQLLSMSVAAKDF